MKPKFTFLLAILLIFGFLLSACNIPGLSAEPTLSPADLQATVDFAVTQVLQTEAISLTGTALAMPTSTNTPEPTLAPPTNTPQPTATKWIPTETKRPVYPTKTLTPTPADYSCKVIGISPAAGTKIKVGTDFDATWKVQNTGLKDWQAGYMDLRYVSGQKMQTYGDVFDENMAVARNGELTLIVDMKAPTTAGKYSAVWALMMEGITMCTLPVDIEAVP